MNLPWLGEDWMLQDPQLLWLLLLVLLGLGLRLALRPKAKDFAPFPFVPQLPRSAKQRSRALPLLLQCLALGFLILAMARPQQKQLQPEVEEGIVMLLCLDLSSSMAATDLDAQQPERNRLAFAQDAAAAFVEARDQDRLGLVSFARDAKLVCPPTRDRRSLQLLLQDLELFPEDHEQDATGIGTALARCVTFLEGSSAPSKVVILLTDGEETVATSPDVAAIHPRQAAAFCRESGVRVYTIATGPDAEATRRTLREVAASTGGFAFAASDATSLTEVYLAIDQLERARFEELPWRWEDRFPPFLLAGLLLFGLSGLLQRSLWEVRA
ncbi:MAG: vWA domain-containing protein [Planctomycetota bacterium]